MPDVSVGANGRHGDVFQLRERRSACCISTFEGNTSDTSLNLPQNESNVTAAVAGAALIVLHLGFGGKPGEQTDLTCDRAHGTACNLTRYANQTQMLETVLATKKPVVVRPTPVVTVLSGRLTPGV